MNDLIRSKLRKLVRDIPDFPKPGIVFKDITPLLADGPALKNCIEVLAESPADTRIDLVVAVESRGFLFGAPLACHLGIGIVPVRKPGKLPYRTVREEYALEYGSDAIEMHEDAVQGKRCLIVDDVLATGGTAAATGRLVERSGGMVVGYRFLIELGFLNGREKLGDTPIQSALTY